MVSDRLFGEVSFGSLYGSFSFSLFFIKTRILTPINKHPNFLYK